MLNQERHLSPIGKIILTCIMCTALIGCGTSTQGITSSAATSTATGPTIAAKPQAPVQVTTKVLVSGLQIPWGLAFLPDGRALVGERASGRLLAITAEGEM